MKVPLRWLNDMVQPGLGLAELVDRLALAGLEVSGLQSWGMPIPPGITHGAEAPYPLWNKDSLLVGKVLRVDKHPDADRLKLPTVEYGEGKTITMVTGAPNLHVGDCGQKVVLALSGAVLFDGHAEPKVLKELKPGKIRGILSEGMVCSGFELGISDDHDGIIFLEDSATVGMPLVDFMGDTILEIDVLPNKGRCLSILGMAREVSAITGAEFRHPSTGVEEAGPTISGKVRVQIEKPKLSGRYAARLIEGVRCGAAPEWMKRRLQQSGMRPINNIVDITNYVMLELGQPLHAFDYDALLKRSGGAAPEITVRPARPGERLTTLDGQVRELGPEILVIADAAGPIALAGLMGGKETEVSESTTRVLLESANFHFLTIRKGMKSLNLPSEAAMRFSKGVPPEMVPLAANRAAELLRLHASGTVAKGLEDCFPSARPAQVIDLPRAEIKRVLGVDIPLEECARIFSALDFKVEKAGADMLKVTVPFHRLDIQEGVADLLEELARLRGYDKLPSTLLAEQLPRQLQDPEFEFEKQTKDLLARLGLQEVISYSLTSPEAEAPCLGQELDSTYVRILNPVSSERTVMRQSLLASVLGLLGNNLKHQRSASLFEVGKTYHQVEGEKLPQEPWKLAVALAGPGETPFWEGKNQSAACRNFFDLKGILEALAEGLHLEKVEFHPGQHPAFHPGKTAVMTVRGVQAGTLGSLHPSLIGQFPDGAGEVLAAEFDLAVLQLGKPTRHISQPVSRFPVALRDIALVVPEAVSGMEVENEIRAAGGKTLKEFRLFDIYQGEGIPPGAKSMAFALTYQAEDHTLNDKEVDKLHKKIEDRVKHVLKAQIRGKDA
ncbi:MAG: phenylalanine--tRNA ligase subunit beta [Gemmataceae bacterium]|nr:phenylalanine--tRNA ligase subunit beta [Gemmataceae bacterium]